MLKQVFDLYVLFFIVRPASAFFRLSCTLLSLERVDPLVTPGIVSTHVHGVAGSSNFSPFATNEDLEKGECTSCHVPADKSAYWAPAIAYQSSQGSLAFLINDEKAIYYKFSADSPAQAFPRGFRMRAGDVGLRTFDPSSRDQQAVAFTCLRAIGDYSAPTRSSGFPTEPCPGGIRPEITFPSCGREGEIDSPDHRAHIAYPLKDGSCPPEFPVRYPVVLFEAIYRSQDFSSKWTQARDPSQPFVLSNGDATGFSFHADFMNGWNVDILNNALRQCTNDNFSPATCAPLQVVSTPCRKTTSVNELVMQDENTVGPFLDYLPGNNPVAGETVPVRAEPGLCAAPQVYTELAARPFSFCVSSIDTSDNFTQRSSEGFGVLEGGAHPSTKSFVSSVSRSLINTQSRDFAPSTLSIPSSAGASNGVGVDNSSMFSFALPLFGKSHLRWIFLLMCYSVLIGASI